MRKLVATVLSLVFLVMSAGPVSARPIIGCGGIVDWPCPGPVIV